MFKLLIGAAIGAAAAWFLDPNDGTRRRNLAQGKLTQVRGKAERGPADERLNDPALQAKVESEIFRDAAAPKGKVSVNVADGVVYLRGELDDDAAIAELRDAAGKVDGVRGVESLLSTPAA